MLEISIFIVKATIVQEAVAFILKKEVLRFVWCNWERFSGVPDSSPEGELVAFSLMNFRLSLCYIIYVEVIYMSKHMSIEDRNTIYNGLNARKPLNQIAKDIRKNRSTISREIRKHLVMADQGAAHRIKNRCIHRNDCQRRGLCEDKPDCVRKCSSCANCNRICPDYVEEHCPLLCQSPYVCNGCTSLSMCVLMKRFYKPGVAQKEYTETLHTAREGYNMTTLELRSVDNIVSPLVRQGQSIHHIAVHAGDQLTVSESTIARLIRDRMLAVTVLDQPRVCKLRPRKSKPKQKKVDRACRINRTYEDYKAFMAEHPELQAVQMDSVIGTVGGKTLLTLIFPKSELMLVFLCNFHTAACVQAWIEKLYEALGADFQRLFPVILTDNGSEFSNPAAIETAPDDSSRTRVFYCDPMASWQKPQVERNHEFIRLILPKGSSFDELSQEDIGRVMSHINSYSRPSLGDKSPFQTFAFLNGQKCLDALLRLSCQTIIPPEKIVLKPSLLG